MNCQFPVLNELVSVLTKKTPDQPIPTVAASASAQEKVIAISVKIMRGSMLFGEGVANILMISVTPLIVLIGAYQLKTKNPLDILVSLVAAPIIYLLNAFRHFLGICFKSFIYYDPANPPAPKPAAAAPRKPLSAKELLENPAYWPKSAQ